MVMSSLSKLRETPSEKVHSKSLVTFLVKSQKFGRICLGCVDENKNWIRPIKPGGFSEKDIVTDKMEAIRLFDVVEMSFSGSYPIKHHKENQLFTSGSSIRFIENLNEQQRIALLLQIASPQVLHSFNSGEHLRDELSKLSKSLALFGPIKTFDLQYGVKFGSRPRIWILNPIDLQRRFAVTCTDIKFCSFINAKLASFSSPDGIISSSEIAEFKDKETFFVIGLTGDSLEENMEIKPRMFNGHYWPLVVSVLTVPEYSCERA
jgi:hypothetical protein